MQKQVEEVVQYLNHILSADGGSVQVARLDSAKIRIRYLPGSNPNCASCVLSPESLVAFFEEALRSKTGRIIEVELEQ